MVASDDDRKNRSSSEATVSPEPPMSESERLATLKILQQENAGHNTQPIAASPAPEALPGGSGARKRGAPRRPKKEKSAASTPKVNDRGEEIYCICRKPDNGEWMIGCDFCDDWFHGDCVNMNEEKAQLVVKFACPRCREKGVVGQWRPKCRLPSCLFPADVANRSKYCTPQHGVMFFQAQLRDMAGITREELARLVRESGGVAGFKELGNTMPSVPQDDVEQRIDAAGIATLKRRSEQLQTEQTELELRRKYIRLCKERTKRLSEELAREAGVKKRDTCGFDARLKTADTDSEAAEYVRAHADDDTLPLGDDLVCTIEKRKCLVHGGWQSIMTDDVELRVTNIREELSHIDKDIQSMYDHERMRVLQAREMAA